MNRGNFLWIAARPRHQITPLPYIGGYPSRTHSQERVNSFIMVLAKSKNAVGLGNSLMNDRFGRGKGADRKKVSAGIHRKGVNGETVRLPTDAYDLIFY
jgi:hypothetical protein